MIFYALLVVQLISCILAIHNVITFPFNTDLNNFRNDGQLASIHYQIIPRGPDLPNMDFRIKLWAAIKIRGQDSNGQQSLRATIVRLDSLTDRRDLNLDYSCNEHDRLWRMESGWPVPLTLRITHPFEMTIDVPANHHADVMQFDFTSHQRFNAFAPKATEIPKVLFHVTSNTRNSPSPLLDKTTTLMSLMNPNYRHVTITLDEVQRIINKLEPRDTLLAYNTLQPVAFKIDLFRLVLMYHFGGVYTDSRHASLIPFDDFLPSNGDFIVKESFPSGFHNAVLAMRKHSLLARLAINLIVANARNRNYGSDVLEPTGPVNLFKAYNLLPADEKAKISTFAQLELKESFVINHLNGQRIFATHNAEYRRRYSSTDKCRYGRLWHDKGVYHEFDCKQN